MIEQEILRSHKWIVSRGCLGGVLERRTTGKLFGLTHEEVDIVAEHVYGIQNLNDSAAFDAVGDAAFKRLKEKHPEIE